MSGTTVSIDNESASASGGTVATATAGYQLTSGGLVQLNNGSGFVTDSTWLLSGAAGDYEVRATLVSGTAPGGSGTGVWLNLGTTRNWTLSAAVGTTQTCTLTIEIRLVATGIVQDTATVTLDSERF